jgi:uncharacterized protein YuzE
MNEKYPIVFYNKDGDILEIKFEETKNGEYAECVNNYLSLIKDNSNEKIIGIELWNFKHLLLKEKKLQEELNDMTDKEHQEIIDFMVRVGWKLGEEEK